MNFKEDSFMVAIALCVVFFVVAQALFFLVRAVKRAKELGIANQTIKNTIVSSSLFTIAACHRHLWQLCLLCRQGLAMYCRG